jgi:hypothetical protein
LDVVEIFFVTAVSVNIDFGCIGTSGNLTIISNGSIYSKCGVLYSKGLTTISASNLENGYKIASSSYKSGAVDSTKPRIERKRYQTYIKYAGWGRLAKTWSALEGEDSFEVITGYRSMTYIKLPASTYPGYIYSHGDVQINAGIDISLGTIVSEGDIYVRGAKQSSRGNLIARGNVRMQMRSSALKDLYIQAQNILVKLIDPLILREYIKPVTVHEGHTIQSVNVTGIVAELSRILGG